MISRAERLCMPAKSMVRVEQEASVSLTPAQRKEVDEAFSIFDYSLTGSLDLHEVKVLMRSLGFSVRRAEVAAIVHRANPECDGKVDLPTFRRIVGERYAKVDPKEKTKEAFRLFDPDGVGKITVKSLKRVSKELGENIGDRELEAMIEEFDKNLDGSISFDEFVCIMEKQRQLES